MDEKIINISMELIATSGNAKSLGLMAVNMAKEGLNQQAQDKLKEARKELTKVHKIHADLISQEAQGQHFEMSLLFVHSQDHLTSAIVILDLAEYLIDLYNKE